MNLRKALAVVALICAALSVFVPAFPLLVIAVVLLAVLHLV
jgi:hypothetical protein